VSFLVFLVNLRPAFRPPLFFHNPPERGPFPISSDAPAGPSCTKNLSTFQEIPLLSCRVLMLSPAPPSSPVSLLSQTSPRGFPQLARPTLISLILQLSIFPYCLFPGVLTSWSFDTFPSFARAISFADLVTVHRFSPPPLQAANSIGLFFLSEQ